MHSNRWLKIHDTNLAYNLTYVRDKCHSYNMRLFFDTTALPATIISRIMQTIRFEYGSEYMGHADARANVLHYEDMKECIFLAPNQLLPSRNNEYFQRYHDKYSAITKRTDTNRIVWKLCTDLDHIDKQRDYYATYNLDLQHLAIGMELGDCREGVPVDKLSEFPIKDNMLFVNPGCLMARPPIYKDMVTLSRIIDRYQPSCTSLGTSIMYERASIFKDFLSRMPNINLRVGETILLGNSPPFKDNDLKQDVCRVEAQVLECYTKELPKYFHERMPDYGISKLRLEEARHYPYNVVIDIPYPLLHRTARPIDAHEDTLVVLGGSTNYSVLRSKVPVKMGDTVILNIRDYPTLALHGLLT